ncbi:deoxynucleoside 5'-monophosphate N-glycosidase [Thermofilum pendens Hrk 5]|uniref:Putative 2'-deoxynucleoside 5'-phosphate N-hydrolase 1 n=1 Tax=Thermofilum pendens (strain DSM 2475 / Hrk 5) TaxID=368408 RepID=DNPH1_THEPD|nr:RecName: Full=Putative 2'-deoxynucleoside 5'-phosphate N-hydrolase 1 [Thermofilum pendens Hrk 5]ABL77427.1 deoxynucleoside 5'-monophosphate N-glycosidase [Thermofilum pendens Hrk 5]
MKVYLAAPMRGDRSALANVKKLLQALEERGYVVLTKHVADDVLDVEKGMTPREVFERDIRLLEEADVLVAEVSYPSLGVGFEIAYFLLRGKPVIALALRERLESVSAMIRGITWENFRLVAYSDVDEAIEKLDSMLPGSVDMQ